MSQNPSHATVPLKSYKFLGPERYERGNVARFRLLFLPMLAGSGGGSVSRLVRVGAFPSPCGGQCRGEGDSGELPSLVR